MITANIVADSINGNKRITTFQLHYPRFIHSEFMTHRLFCLSADTELDFELPAGQGNNVRRKYSMTIEDFVHKWLNGSKEHKTSRHNGIFLEGLLDPTTVYYAKEVAAILKQSGASNLNNACKLGRVVGAYKEPGEKAWKATGQSWIDWRASTGTRTYNLKTRLSDMRIRQYNELTGEVTLSHVTDAMYSGKKLVYELTTSNGYLLKASKDHLVLTKRGWLTLAELVVGSDEVITYKYEEGCSDPNKYKKIDGKWVTTWCRQIRDLIANRQNGLCACTKEPLEPSFHIHHIVPVHKDPSKAFDTSNVIAVNETAHRTLHSEQGWQQGIHLTSVYSIVASIEAVGEEDTYDLSIAGDFANFFANGIVVHNSRNASSSRAIPVSSVIDAIQTNCATPVDWGKNQPGMQAKESFTDEAASAAYQAWLDARDSAVFHANKLAALGLHKQIVNRVVEPFQHMNVIVTATEWANFFHLRAHADAQPEIRVLAEKMKVAYEASKPHELFAGEWHLPFVNNAVSPGTQIMHYYVDNKEVTLEEAKMISASACAQVSYRKNDLSLEKAKMIWDKLIFSDPCHASPVEHQATPLVHDEQAGLTHFDKDGNRWSGNFKGWVQLRKLLPNEAVW